MSNQSANPSQPSHRQPPPRRTGVRRPLTHTRPNIDDQSIKLSIKQTDPIYIQTRSRSRMRDDEDTWRYHNQSISHSPSKSRNQSVLCGMNRIQCLIPITCLIIMILLIYRSTTYSQHTSNQSINGQWPSIMLDPQSNKGEWFCNGCILMVSAQEPVADVQLPPAVEVDQVKADPVVEPVQPTEPVQHDVIQPSEHLPQRPVIEQNIPVIPTRPFANDVPVLFMNQSVFPHWSNGYPLFSEPTTLLYSSFYCMGGRGREGSHGDRSCRFQNLCYKPSTDQWLFYQDPTTRGQMPILLDHGLVITEFPQKFLNLRSMGNPEDAKFWAPTQVYESIPAAARVPRHDQSRADVHVLYHSHYPANIGHIIGDDFFPLFNLQLSFGMLTNDVQLIMSRDCDKIFLASAPTKTARARAWLCHKFMDTLTPGLSRRSVLAATQTDFAEKLGLAPGSDLLCFENVLAGSGPWGFQQSLGKAPSWWQYHHYYLSNMGLSPNHTPKKHRITISIKDGKRSIYNNAEMFAHLKKTFPDYEIDTIELYKLGGWQRELTYLQDTSVLITPCGGVSMSSMFLPHGAAIIVVDYWNVNKNNTVGMEERLWTNLGFVRSYHYPFFESEVWLEADRVRWKYQDMRDWGRVKVNVERMELLLRDAIRHVDAFMIKGIE